MPVPRIPFEITENLDTEQAISEYLSPILADGNTDELIRALNHVVKVRGMTQIAKDSGINRARLYKALALGAKPSFHTVVKVMRAMGVVLRARPVPT